MTKPLILLAILMPFGAQLVSGTVLNQEVSLGMSDPQVLVLRNSTDSKDRQSFNRAASSIVDQAWAKAASVYLAIAAAGLIIFTTILYKSAFRHLSIAWKLALFLAVPAQLLVGYFTYVAYGFRHG